jgi:ADP-ribose pyrophosphatase YjhB (NUDIX family)
MVLLVRRASDPCAGDWALPVGFVEHGETVQAAVQHEVFEEAGVEAEVEGLIAVLNRAYDDVNDAYLICLLRAKNEKVRADGVEVD